MNKMQSLSLSLVCSVALISGSALAGSHGDKVKGFAVDSSGNNWMSGSGECVRSSYLDSSKRPEACGYAMAKPEPAPAAAPDVTRETVKMPTAESDTMKMDKEIVISSGILFAFDSDVLSDEGKLVILERIEKYGHPANKMAVHVVGHTDSIGSDAYNMDLSLRRANAVADYIRQMKKSPFTQVDASGMGESEPVADNSTPEGRKQNRRVVVTAVGTTEK